MLARVTREKYVSLVADMARGLKDHGLWPNEDVLAAEAPEQPTGGKADARWPLWRDLRDRLAEVRGVPYDEPPWTPFRFALDRERGYVVFSFDHRLSERAVKGALKRELPRMRERGWLRETYYSVGKHDRALTLVRYVCLESPASATWRDRVTGWLASSYVKEHPEWGKPYHGDQASRRFERDFHQAEAALAGPQVELTAGTESHKGEHALAIFYDRRTQEAELVIRGMAERAERAVAGDPAAREAEVELLRRSVGDDEAEALRHVFQVDDEIEALVSEAVGGHAAAEEEAHRRVGMEPSHWREEDLRKRLAKVRADRDPDTRTAEAREQFIAGKKQETKKALADALRAHDFNDRKDDSVSPVRLRCTRCGRCVALRESVLGLCLTCARIAAGED
jgi:hypothetical protein